MPERGKSGGWWSPCVAALLVLGCVCVAATLARAWEPRKPLIYGVGARPFPALAAVDYPFMRARAWLEAVGRAEALLPSGFDGRIRQLGLPVGQARKAIAALACPLDVATPEHATGQQVRVFLKGLSGLALDGILADPWRLLLEMCILWETGNTLAIMGERWPKGEADTQRHLPFLEEQASLLRQLWQAAQVNAADTSQDRPEESEVRDASVALLLMYAMGRPEGEENLGYADRAIELCMDREVSGDPALWAMLAACGNYLRARGHERRGQPALAELDLDMAITRMRKSGVMPRIEAETTLIRAELRRKRGNWDGMCDDYRAACSLGLCQSLARARREGRCNP